MAGPSSSKDRLTFLFTRLRSSGAPPRTDIEPFLSRSFWMPTARTFSLTGQARISPLVPDDAIDRLVGRPGSDGSGVQAYSSGRLNGDLTAGAIATLDGNSQTAWEPGLGATHQAGSWLKYDLPAPISFGTMNLQVVADGRHSVPTSLTVSTENGSRHLQLPPVGRRANRGIGGGHPPFIPRAQRSAHHRHLRHGPPGHHCELLHPGPSRPYLWASPRWAYPASMRRRCRRRSRPPAAMTCWPSTASQFGSRCPGPPRPRWPEPTR